MFTPKIYARLNVISLHRFEDIDENKKNWIFVPIQSNDP